MIREKDWSATTLGPIEGWPGSLRTTTDMVLGAKMPMVVLWGEDAVLLYNDAYERVIGEKHPAALGGRACEVAPEVWEEAGPVFESVMATGEAAEAKRQALSSERNGDCWFDYTLNPVRGFDGKVEGVLAIAHEVTGGVEAEAERDRHCEAMRESERRARAFVSNLPGGAAFVVDRDLRYLLADGEALQEAGLSPDDLQGKSIFEALEPGLAASYEPILRRALAGEPFSHEHEGHDRAYLSRGVPLRDEGGEVYAVLVVSYDITDRKRAEEALRANEERFRTLVENVRDYAIFMTDRQGVVTEWTAGAERVKGYTAEEAVGRHLSAFYAPEDLAAGDPARELAEAAREGRAEHEGWRVRKGGERFWVNEIATAVRDEGGGLIGFTKISRDLTERRRADEALRRAARANAYRIALADALRTLADPVEIRAEAARVLGEHLGASRVLYAEMLDDARTAVIEADYRRGGTPSVVGRHRLDAFGPSVPEILGAGRTLVMHDYGEISDLAPGDLAAYVAVGIYAHVTVPLVKAGRFAAFLSVHQSAPRAWTEDEVALIEETAERTWAAVEKARAEEDLRESNERLRLAADAARLGRWELVPETGEIFGDVAWKEHHGAPQDSEPGFEDYVESIHREDRDAVRREVARALEDGGGHEAEYRVLLPGGGARWIFSRAHVFRGGSAPERLVGVTLDVTEGRELERERERLRARELTAHAEASERERISRELHDRVAHSMGISHQSLELHAALAETSPYRAQEKLDLARETTRRALDQTRSLAAELKRMQEGELENGMEAAFEALVETSVPEEVSVSLSFSGDNPIPKPIAVQAYLVMREAVRNAVKHSGCQHLAVRLEVMDRRVLGVVEDDGSGFDPDAVEGASPSWGMGLRSMRERATMLGGSLRVSSKPREGTRVEVTVPLDASR